MARATTTRTSERKTRGTAVAEMPKRKPGRPAGSTNAKKSASPVARATKTAGRPAKTAAAPKLNKAALEVHVSKLERTVTRLREKNKELKQAASDAREHADSLEERLAARPAAEAPAPRKTRRGSAKQTALSASTPSEDESVEA